MSAYSGRESISEASQLKILGEEIFCYLLHLGVDLVSQRFLEVPHLLQKSSPDGGRTLGLLALENVMSEPEIGQADVLMKSLSSAHIETAPFQTYRRFY